MSKFDYDLICIGSGSAGGAAAFVAKRAGKKVAIVEAYQDKLGGHCPNYACVPTKALLKAAQVYKTVQTASSFGIHSDNIRFSFAEIGKYRQRVVDQLTGTRIEKNLASAGIDLLWGKAKFVSKHILDVRGKKYSSEHILIATGSKEWIPPIQGLIETGYWTSDQAVKLDVLPESIIIVGAGPIGVEFSQIFSSFGVQVTLLQKMDQILQREDKEVADYVHKDLASRGVDIFLEVDIVEAHQTGKHRFLNTRIRGQEQIFSAEDILIATGRRPFLEELNLEAGGLKLNNKGFLDLNEYLQTDVANIWAGGDVAGNWQFTHTAAYEGDLIGRNICHQRDEKVNYEVVPRVTFCDPEVASVGITEKEATVKRLHIKTAKFFIGSLGRALIDQDRRGFVKLIVDPDTLQILGGHVVGADAGELIHEIALAMRGKIPVTEIGRMIHAYPTFSESIAAVAEQFLD